MRHKQTSINKITPPALPKVVLRKRLFRLLDKKQHYQVTWVSGVAGSGKTTLVASYLENGHFPCLWYQMDERDADIATFFYYLGLAAKKATPRKRKPLPFFTPEYFPGASVFARRFFENLSSRVSLPFFIIFDDYHKVPMASPLHDVLKDCLSSLSRDIHIIVISRTDPLQDFVGMMANNKMRLIGSCDLSLNFEESKKIIKLNTEKKLPTKIVERIYEKTKGWAAGLILMAKSDELDNAMPTSFNAYASEKIFEYFAAELIDKMNETYREFLLKTAFFPKMSTSMAKTLTGRYDADTILQSLRRNHSFTGKFSAPEDIYQYHPLFREFLVARATNTFTQEEIQKLQQRAAEILQVEGQFEDAVDLFFEANDYNNLALLIQKQANELVIQGRNKTLEQWIRKFPQHILNQEPWLLFWLGMSCLHFSSAEARTYFQSAFELFQHRKDMTGVYLSWSGIIDSIAYERNDFTEFDPWIKWLDENVSAKHAFPSVEIEARVAVRMMLALLIRKPDRSDMIQRVKKALLLSRKSGDINLYMQAIDWAMTYYAWMGDFAKIEIIRQESQELAKSHRTSPAMVIHWRWIDISVRICTMDQIDSIPDEISRALVMVKETGLYMMEHLFLMPGIFVSFLLRDISTAEALLKRFESTLDISHYHSFSIFHHFTGLYHLHTGNMTQARSHAETALKISHGTGYPLATIVCRFQLAYILYVLGEVEKGKQELSRTTNLAVKTNSRIFEFMCLMLSAKFALEQKKENQGLKLLGQAMALGRQLDYLNMVWWWHPAMMAELCEKALLSDIETDYVKKLIRIHHLTPESPPYHVESWPWALKIHTLDGFQILKDDEPIHFSGKVQKKPLDLLKVLVAYGGIEVNVEQIIDSLWYEADGDMAHSAFSTTLNRLRKLIGAKDVIQLHDGKITLNQNYCQLDTWAFERMLNQAQKLAEQGQDKKTIFLYEKAINIYRGHFLAKESQEPWMIPLRERLKNRFLEAILKLGKCREQQKEFVKAIECYEKGLAIDNLEEIFYEHIMLCCQSLGRKAKTIEVYHRCREALQSILEIEPSVETEAIYQKIIKHR